MYDDSRNLPAAVGQAGAVVTVEAHRIGVRVEAVAILVAQQARILADAFHVAGYGVALIDGHDGALT